MFEALPRLAVLQASGVAFDKLIVPERLSRFHRETLEILGFDETRLQPLTNGHIAPEALIWCSPLAPVGYPTPFLVEWLRRSFAVPQGAPTRKAYLSRDTRTVVNERDFLPDLVDRGFDVLNPSTLSMREQVDYFATVKLAVGPHGAAFCNGVFSSHLTGCEIYQPDHANISTSAVFAACGHEHWSLLARRMRGFHRRSHQNMTVSQADILDTVTWIDH